jgi:hypothetical protein
MDAAHGSIMVDSFFINAVDAILFGQYFTKSK